MTNIKLTDSTVNVTEVFCFDILSPLFAPIPLGQCSLFLFCFARVRTIEVLKNRTGIVGIRPYRDTVKI